SARFGGRHDAAAWRAQRSPFRPRDERRLATLSLSRCKPVAARAACAHGSERVLATALRNSKKPGRQNRVQIAQRRYHRSDFAGTERTAFDRACRSCTAHERWRLAFHARFIAE